MPYYWIGLKSKDEKETEKFAAWPIPLDKDPCKYYELMVSEYGTNHLTLLKEVFPKVTIKAEKSVKEE
jgi:hypothetical protein